MAEFVSKHYDVSGIKVEVLEAGTGEPLVFFHPAGTGSGFDNLLPLAENRRLIIPYHPGFGGSEDDPAIDSVIDYVVHYDALFDQLGIEGAVDIVGHSLGGWIASTLAVFNPGRVKRLALVCPVGLKVSEHPTQDIFTVPENEFASYMFAKAPPRRELPREEMIEQVVTRAREMASLARFAWFRCYEPKLARWLERVKVPVLLLWGTADRMVPVEQSERWEAALGGPVKTIKYEQAGHQLLVESAEAVPAINDFFAA
jgi:pimeloyl-ACP methyl ester carboxylesterase